MFWVAGSAMGHPPTPIDPQADIVVFTRAGCPYCAVAKLFLEDLERERPELRIVSLDVEENPGALARLKDLAAKHGVRRLGVPAFYLRGELVVGYASEDTTGKRIKALLDKPSSSREEKPEGACVPELSTPCEQTADEPSSEVETVETPLFGRLNARELGLPAFTLLLGLLDGFNPCAMWVLLFLLSLLVNLRDRLKMALIAGTFVAVSGLVYFALMAAWLNVFLLVGLSRTVQVVIGGIAGLVGAINVKDFFALGSGVSLSIPQAAKPGLYARARRILTAEHLPSALLGIAMLAVLVNMIELLCTAGFPAIYTQILTLRRLPWWEYYGYLALYNAAYILDDSLMVTIAGVTLSHRKLQEQGGRWLKLISGAVMLGLGMVLIAKPDWLAV